MSGCFRCGPDNIPIGVPPVDLSYASGDDSTEPVAFTLDRSWLDRPQVRLSDQVNEAWFVSRSLSAAPVEGVISNLESFGNFDSLTVRSRTALPGGEYVLQLTVDPVLISSLTDFTSPRPGVADYVFTVQSANCVRKVSVCDRDAGFAIDVEFDRQVRDPDGGIQVFVSEVLTPCTATLGRQALALSCVGSVAGQKLFVRMPSALYEPRDKQVACTPGLDTTRLEFHTDAGCFTVPR